MYLIPTLARAHTHMHAHTHTKTSQATLMSAT